MLNCGKIQNLLSQYANAELITPLRAQVDEHLRQCSACRQELDTEMELLTTLGNLPLVSCPEFVSENILEAIEMDEKRQNSNRVFWPLGAATLVAAGLALILLLPQDQSKTNPGFLDNGRTFTNEEIQTATSDARLALAKVASVINRNETSAFEQVFGEEIPGAVGGSLLLITKNLQGEV